MADLRILVVGSGAREHALAWKLAQSPRAAKVYVAPGNAGTSDVAENLFVPADDIDGLLEIAKHLRVDLTVVGPDKPLALGIVDRFRAEGLRIFGPTQAAARLEWSKAYAKQFMLEEGIPTASHVACASAKVALAFARTRQLPLVVKADGLAKGKGVTVCRTWPQFEQAMVDCLTRRRFRDAGSLVVIEEFLDGPEVSVHALCDGRNFVLLPPAQDHKPLCDGDEGPMTGGMGTIAPVPFLTAEQLADIGARIVRPTLDGMRRREKPFVGCLYVGLKLTAEGPKVLEYNARFGDPETQVILPILKGDLLGLFEACLDGTLPGSLDAALAFASTDLSAACVVLAAKGYPGESETGREIDLSVERLPWPGNKVFHAATLRRGEELLTDGGRILAVTSWERSLATAIRHAYALVDHIFFSGMQYRSDIGARYRAGN